MQGIDDYITWLVKKVKQLMGGGEEEYSEVHQKIENINKKVRKVVA